MLRRSFLGTMLATVAAPAIVRADSLMRCIPTGTVVLTHSGLSLLTEAQRRIGNVIDGRLGVIENFPFIQSNLDSEALLGMMEKVAGDADELCMQGILREVDRPTVRSTIGADVKFKRVLPFLRT